MKNSVFDDEVMSRELPGGLWRDGALHRDYAFKALNGAVELAMTEALEETEAGPAQVTAVLAAALEILAGASPARVDVEQLCVGDRQFLMRRLAIHAGRDHHWLSAGCAQCGERFDFAIRLSQLPVKQAGDGFPFARVNASQGELTLRVPNGADQQALGDIFDEELAEEELLQRCLQGDPASLAGLTETDRQLLDTALENLSPEITTELQTICPHCGHPQIVQVHAYIGTDLANGSLLDDIHQLAWHYHWSEAEILAMPRKRRQRYLDRIDRARGFHTSASPVSAPQMTEWPV